MNQKNSGLAAVFSFFIPGVGQIYNGQIWQGFALMVIFYFGCIPLMAVGIGFVLVPIVWVAGIYDAYTQAEKINKANS